MRSMDIRFVSTLTSEDEARVGEALLAALVAMLEGLPITYALRIETTNHKIFQHSNMGRVASVTNVVDESEPAQFL